MSIKYVKWSDKSPTLEMFEFYNFNQQVEGEKSEVILKWNLNILGARTIKFLFSALI